LIIPDRFQFCIKLFQSENAVSTEMDFVLKNFLLFSIFIAIVTRLHFHFNDNLIGD